MFQDNHHFESTHARLSSTHAVSSHPPRSGGNPGAAVQNGRLVPLLHARREYRLGDLPRCDA